MLPAFIATERLANHLSNKAVALSDAERLIRQHGFEVERTFDLSYRVCELFECAELIFKLMDSDKS